MLVKGQYTYILVEDQVSESRIFQIVWNEITKNRPLKIFANGKDLINYLLQQDPNHPHLIILDINLPGMLGHEVLTTIRKLSITKYSPIIVFSTSITQKDIAKSYMSLATSYVQKPSDLEEMRKFIQSTYDHWSNVIPPNTQYDPLTNIPESQSQDLSFLASVLEGLPNMVFVKEAKDLRFIYFNRAGEDLLGLSRETLIGKNDYDFFPKEQADFFTKRDRTVLSSQQPMLIPKEKIETKNNGTRQLYTRKVPLFLSKSSKEPTHLLGISNDITESGD